MVCLCDDDHPLSTAARAAWQQSSIYFHYRLKLAFHTCGKSSLSDWRLEPRAPSYQVSAYAAIYTSTAENLSKKKLHTFLLMVELVDRHLHSPGHHGAYL